jgi:3-oxoacyl-[acyl-carrier-protein] synthase-3
LFGDAGTATALEFDETLQNKMSFIIGTDGSGEDAIKITHGGARNLFDESSLQFQNYDPNSTNKRKNTDLYLNGVDVFNFAIKTVPKTINDLLDYLNLTVDNIDFFALHQANLFMNETIKKRLKIPSEKLIYSIKEYGNTNGASIPVTICSNFSNEVKPSNFIMCGFGVGLSWGAIHFANHSIIKTCISKL